jgi:hypothetical protein
MVSSEERVAKLKKLFELERENDLFSFRVDGWSAWRVLRFPLYQLVQGLPLARASRPTLVRVMEALSASVKLIWLIGAGRKRELLVKTCRTALRLRRGGFYRDIYFDTLLEHRRSGLKLEEINSDAFSRQAANAFRPADLNPVAITFWGRILGILFPVNCMSFCKRISELLLRETNTSVAPRNIRLMLSTVYWQSRLYRAFLSRIRPSVVLLAETGDYALRIASNRQHVPLVELQHGIFDAEHPDAIPSWVEGTAAELVLPDVLACYGSFWIEQLNSTRQGNGRAIPIGNELIDGARRQIRPRPSNQPTHLVLTSQGLDSQRLVRWLMDMIAGVPDSLEWRMSIKLHPVNDVNSREFDALRGDHRVAIIEGADDRTIYDLLADADLHLSIGSACHFDAAALGVRTLIIPLAGHEPLLRLIDGKQFFLPRHPSDVWSIAVLGRLEPESAHRFAAPGYGPNLHRLVDRLLSDWAPISGLTTPGPAVGPIKVNTNV